MFVFLKENNVFIMQGHINLVKSKSKYAYICCYESIREQLHTHLSIFINQRFTLKKAPSRNIG